MKAVQIIVRGKVQGVGFRYYSQKKAAEFDVKGFVKNQPDGSVYIEAEGKTIDLETFVDWCRKGPMWAKVREFTISDIPFSGFTVFEIR
jgi:acylphosphatase